MKTVKIVGDREVKLEQEVGKEESIFERLWRRLYHNSR